MNPLLAILLLILVLSLLFMLSYKELTMPLKYLLRKAGTTCDLSVILSLWLKLSTLLVLFLGSSGIDGNFFWSL